MDFHQLVTSKPLICDYFSVQHVKSAYHYDSIKWQILQAVSQFNLTPSCFWFLRLIIAKIKKLLSDHS